MTNKVGKEFLTYARTYLAYVGYSPAMPSDNNLSDLIDAITHEVMIGPIPIN